jgi:S1-C subfamily serine protease
MVPDGLRSGHVIDGTDVIGEASVVISNCEPIATSSPAGGLFAARDVGADDPPVAVADAISRPNAAAERAAVARSDTLCNR